MRLARSAATRALHDEPDDAPGGDEKRLDQGPKPGKGLCAAGVGCDADGADGMAGTEAAEVVAATAAYGG